MCIKQHPYSLVTFYNCMGDINAQYPNCAEGKSHACSDCPQVSLPGTLPLCHMIDMLKYYLLLD